MRLVLIALMLYGCAPEAPPKCRYAAEQLVTTAVGNHEAQVVWVYQYCGYEIRTSPHKISIYVGEFEIKEPK